VLKIGNRKLGKNKPVFVIAEAGVNYNNNLSFAYKMVDLAVMAGADAVKFQTFKADDVQLKNSIKPRYQNKIKRSYYDLIKKLEPSFNDQIKIRDYCKKKNIIFLSTPSDRKSVDFLYKLGVPAFKIASSDLNNHILLEYIAKKKRPILLSTGLATIDQVDETVKLLNDLNMKNKTVLLQATSDYPCKNEEVNLRVMTEYSKRYDILVGLSDHTKDYSASLGAVALGACVVEKHFTLNKRLSGPDQSSSLNPQEVVEWTNKIRIMEKSLGTNRKLITESEKRNLSMRKILVIKPAKKGTIITKDILDAMRGTKDGILPVQRNTKKIIGKRLLTNVPERTQFSWNMIK